MCPEAAPSLTASPRERPVTAPHRHTSAPPPAGNGPPPRHASDPPLATCRLGSARLGPAHSLGSWMGGKAVSSRVARPRAAPTAVTASAAQAPLCPPRPTVAGGAEVRPRPSAPPGAVERGRRLAVPSPPLPPHPASHACLLLPGSAAPRGGQVPVPGHRRGLGVAGPGRVVGGTVGGDSSEPRSGGGSGMGSGPPPAGASPAPLRPGERGGPGEAPAAGRPSEPGAAGQARVQPFPRSVPPSK